MSLRPASLRSQPRAPRPSSVCSRQTPNGERSSSTAARLASLFSYSYKRLCPQPFSFDTHTNAPGSGIGASNQTFLEGRAASCSFALCAHSFAVRGNSSPFFSIASALFAETTGVYPNNSLPRGLSQRGQLGNRAILPAHLPTAIHSPSCFSEPFHMDKRISSPDAAIANLKNGMTILMGGFGLCGIPENLIAAVQRAGTKDQIGRASCRERV